jgi:hypothetical protein
MEMPCYGIHQPPPQETVVPIVLEAGLGTEQVWMFLYKRKISCPSYKLNPILFNLQPSHYTIYTSPAPLIAPNSLPYTSKHDPYFLKRAILRTQMVLHLIKLHSLDIYS